MVYTLILENGETYKVSKGPTCKNQSDFESRQRQMNKENKETPDNDSGVNKSVFTLYFCDTKVIQNIVLKEEDPQKRVDVFFNGILHDYIYKEFNHTNLIVVKR